MKILLLENPEIGNYARQWPAHPPDDLKHLRFEFGTTTEADHVVVLNGLYQETKVFCPPDRVWALMLEPPSPRHTFLHRGQPAFRRVYTSDETLTGPSYVPSGVPLPWGIHKSYDELKSLPYPQKHGELSWITSNLALMDGHRLRMAFLDKLRNSGLPLELWGRGFRPIESKWNVLAPFRYSIAFENFGGSLYWSEKIIDCFLSYTTPFYFGGREIDRLFPRGSYIPIDPGDPHVFDRMKDAIASGYHREHLPELLEARERCLHDYNIMFFIARQVADYEPTGEPARWITIQGLTPPEIDRSVLGKARKKLSSAVASLWRPRPRT